MPIPEAVVWWREESDGVTWDLVDLDDVPQAADVRGAAEVALDAVVEAWAPARRG